MTVVGWQFMAAARQQTVKHCFAGNLDSSTTHPQWARQGRMFGLGRLSPLSLDPLDDEILSLTLTSLRTRLVTDR